MKNYFCLGLALGLAFAVASQDALARGGRGGGRPGGARPNFAAQRPGNLGQHQGNFKNNNLGDKAANNKNFQGGDFNSGNVKNYFPNKTSQVKSNFAGPNRPFTPAWYANHPGAWQFTHPHADAWAVASLGTAAAWLGLSAADGGYYYDDSYSEYDDDASDDTASDDTVLTGEVEDASTDEVGSESTSDAAAAAALAQAGAAAPADDSANYLPLGVFVLAPQNQQDATAMLQVAVSKDGFLRGSYFDLVSEQDYPIQGSVDKKTQRVGFTVGPKGKTVFETQLADLTQPGGEVSLHFADGTASDWTLARYDNASEKTSGNESKN